METRTETGESSELSAWLAAATPDPELSLDRWALHPHLPRRLDCGVLFDVVLAKQALVQATFSILQRYEQPLGPAVVFGNIGSSAILVPPGTAERWRPLTATSRWPDRFPRPVCLGRRGGHKIQVPAPSPLPNNTTALWLERPADDLVPGRGPLLTSPAPLARCLTEASTLLAPDPESTSMRRAVSAGRLILRSPQRT